MTVSASKRVAAQRSRKRTILLRNYAESIAHTDALPKRDIKPVLFGLYGEVGSVLSAAKKLDREGSAYTGFKETLKEELGDALWYLTTLCTRLDIRVEELFRVAAQNREAGTPSKPPQLALLGLGESAAQILAIKGRQNPQVCALIAFAEQYIRVIQANRLTLSQIAKENIEKVRGRFLDPDLSKLPLFDKRFDEDEQLPRNFQIMITQRPDGRSYLKLNNVFIGDSLDDNIGDSDGYRFHDVFHFAHAAILNWSPVVRALLKRKRKSVKRYDRNQDGGRAIVVEEGLTAWIFSRAKKLDFFEDKKGISFDMLKTIGQFVQGYEVDKCPLNLWEHAILQGYKVFREVHRNNGGIVCGDLATRSIRYRALRKR